MPRFISFQYGFSSSFNLFSPLRTMFLKPLMVGSLVRLVTALVAQPTATVTTLLYYSDHLPRNLNLERLVRSELLHPDNYLFHFLVNLLKCFW